jgi:hypothetical protein
MKAQPDKIGIAAIKLNNLKEEGLTRKEFIAKSRAILFDLVYEKTNDKASYVKRLEEEVKDYRTLKRLLK